MALFGKNPNEAVYVGGKKHWTDVIKNSGSGEFLIWRQPEEDFNTNSTVIVMPGEEAIFIDGGKIVQVLENGTHKLSTNNYPFISRLRNAFSGGISTFNCVVYFVRKADSKEIRWGTQSPIQVRDKVWNIRTDAKVRAVYKVRIVNPSIFLEKLIGNNINYQFQEELDKYFEGEFQGKIKSQVSKFLNSLEQELIGIDAYMDELSEKIEPYIDEILADYGLKCVKFALVAIDIDNTKYDEIDISQIGYIGEVRGYQGGKAGVDILGEDWGRVQGVGVLKDLANNPGAGGVAAAGAGMGMGIGAAGAFGSIAQQVFAPVTPGFGQQPSYGQQFGNGYNNQPSRFTQQQPNATQAEPVAQPAPVGNAQEDPMAAMGKLKQMFDAGFITEDEFNAKKAEILSRM